MKPSYQKIDVDPAFPVRAIYMNSQPGRDLFYCHWHPNIEIIHVLEGKVRLYIDHIPHDLDVGDLCIINPNQVHFGNERNQIYSKVQLVVLSYDILPYSHDDLYFQKFIAPLQSGDYQLPTVLKKQPPSDLKLSADNYRNCRDLLLKLIDYGMHMFNGREIAVQGALLEFIAAMHHHQLLFSASDKGVKRIGSRNMAILEYVEENFTKALSVPTIAHHFNLSEDYFYRLFKKYTGQTHTTFINQLRIRYSKQLLRNTDMSISEISYEVGYASSSYYAKMFTRYNDLSPSQYRKQYAAKTDIYQ